MELRLRIPDEIKQYQKIISNQEAIINEAHTQANAILADATAQTNELVNEHEIMQKAYAEANRVVEEAQQQAQAIVDSAAVDANSIRQGAIDYTDDMLRSLQTIMSHTMEESRRHLEAFNASLQSTYDIVTANRNELSAGVSNAPVAEEQAQPVAPAPAQEATTEEK